MEFKGYFGIKIFYSIFQELFDISLYMSVYVYNSDKPMKTIA